jgi:hypothetical protein
LIFQGIPTWRNLEFPFEAIEHVELTSCSGGRIQRFADEHLRDTDGDFHRPTQGYQQNPRSEMISARSKMILAQAKMVSARVQAPEKSSFCATIKLPLERPINCASV